MWIDRVKLAVAMTRSDINSKRLAELSGISRVTISAIRNGKRCALKTATKVAKALGVDVTEIIKEG